MVDPKIRLQKSFLSVLVIDEAQIDVRVKRMTNKEFDDYALKFAAFSDAKPPAPQTPDQKAATDDDNRAWIRDSLDRYFDIVPGQIDDAGHDVTRGGELLDLYGGRSDVVPQALALVYGENCVQEKKKDAYRSGLVSRLGLVAETPVDSGSAPAPVATAAEPPSSAGPAAVTERFSGASSGTTVQ